MIVGVAAAHALGLDEIKFSELESEEKKAEPVAVAEVEPVAEPVAESVAVAEPVAEAEAKVNSAEEISKWSILTSWFRSLLAIPNENMAGGAVSEDLVTQVIQKIETSPYKNLKDIIKLVVTEEKQLNELSKKY